MNNSATANKTSSQPLERMKTPAQKAVFNPDEQIEIDSIGHFENSTIPKSVIKCIEAPCILIDNFNPEPRVEIPRGTDKAFEDEDPSKLNPDLAPISELFKDGASVTFGVLQKGVDFLGNVTGETGGALSELVKTVSGKTEVPQAFHQAFEGENDSHLDPTKAAEEQNEQEVFITAEKAKTTLENAKEQASRQEYEEMIKMALRMGVNVESLADKLNAPHLRKADLLKIYYLALGDSLQVAEKKVAARVHKFVPGASKQGGQGLSLENNKANESAGGNTNATNAVG